MAEQEKNHNPAQPEGRSTYHYSTGPAGQPMGAHSRPADGQIPATGMNQNTQPASEPAVPRRRRRPAMAGPGQKAMLVILGLILAFALGTLAGIGLSYNAWVVNGEPEPSQEAYRIPDVEDTEPQETKPEETKPEETKPEETKPEETKPEETKPEETKPEETKPQETEPPATEPPATEPPASAYIIPDSDSRYLSAEDYQSLSDWELVLARNEIFARHGRRFSNADIQEYFDGCSWYKGTIDPDDFDSSVFNDYELKNIQLLKAASDAR